MQEKGEKMNEFVIEWIKGNSVASVTCPSSSQLAGKIRKLAEKSKEITVISDTNGALFAHVPVSCVNIRKPNEMSDEQRQAAAERLKKVRES